MPKYSEGDVVNYAHVPDVKFEVTYINDDGTYDIDAVVDGDEEISASYVPESLLSKAYPSAGEEVESAAQLHAMPEGSIVEWPGDAMGVLVKYEDEWHVTGGHYAYSSNVIIVHGDLRVVRIGRPE